MRQSRARSRWNVADPDEPLLKLAASKLAFAASGTAYGM